MEQIDSAQSAFKVIQQFALENSERIVSEADARFQLIDRILLEVLGWPREAIRTEPLSSSGYIDYLLSSGGRNAFVVEAKRTSLTLVTTKFANLRYYRVGSAALRDAQDGISQAARYCASKSVPFAALTNGLSWIGFRANRLDGIDMLEGVAAVFPDFDSISQNFSEFYDLFSHQGIRSRLYNIHLDRQEGSALSSTDPLFFGSSRISGKRGFDLQEEEFRVAVAIRHPFHHLDAVVDAFKLSGVHRPA